MKLLVNGSVVEMEYLGFEESSGHILRILVAASVIANETELHANLVEALKATYPCGGMMDRAAVEDGLSEIRILGGLMLETIDTMRRAGFGVQETMIRTLGDFMLEVVGSPDPA